MLNVVCWRCHQPVSNGQCLNIKCAEDQRERLSKKSTQTSDKITSKFGGTRQPISRRYDLLFQEFGDAIDAWAEIIDYGEKKHGHLNWHKLDFESEQSPLNHAIGHIRKAASAKVGSSYRRRQLAKVLWNIAAQMWYDSKHSLDKLPKSVLPGKVFDDPTQGP